MFTILPESQVYCTPIKSAKFLEDDEMHQVNRNPSDCISFTKNSGNKFTFQVRSFNDYKYAPKDMNFQAQVYKEVNDKTQGIKNILGKLGEVDSLVNSQFSKVRNAKPKQILNQNEDQSQKENYPPIQDKQQNVLYSSKIQNRSCTKSCSKIQQQIKKYQNNQEFQLYKNMLKDITFSESNKKTPQENKIKQEGESSSLARRRLDFDTQLEEDFDNFLDLETPKKSKLSTETSSTKEDDTMIQEEIEDDYDTFEEPIRKKIFLKNIERGQNFVNYFYIYRTHN